MELLLKIIFFLMIFFSGIYSQNELRFEHFSLEQGLSQSTVHSIYQDKNGFIWFGTQNGLNRYDGYQFINFLHDSYDSLSLSNGFVKTILQDKSGLLWIGTNNGLNLLTLLTEKSGKKSEGFRHFFSSSDKTSLSSNDIRTIYQDKNNNIWIGTSNGLNKIIINKNYTDNNFNSAIRFQRFFIHKSDSAHNIISSIAEDKNGNLWIGTLGNGLLKFDIKTTKFSRFQKASGNISINYILTLVNDHEGNLWIGTYGSGIFKYDFNIDSLIHFQTGSYNPSSNKIYAIQQDNNRHIWAATLGGGILNIHNKFGKIICFYNQDNDSKTLGNNFVRSLLIDCSGVLWAGTNKGIYKADLKSPKFKIVKRDQQKLSNLDNNFILSFYEDKPGNIWIGTNKGLNKLDTRGIFSNYVIKHNNPQSEEGFVTTITGINGNLLIGTFGGGLFVFDSQKEKVIQHYRHSSDNDGLIDNRVTTILNEKNGNYLIGTVNGICRLDVSTGKVYKNLKFGNDSVKISNTRINIMLLDREQNLWIGTNDGLYKRDTSNKITLFKNESNIYNSLSNNTISALFEDSGNHLWIGTDNGLNKYDKKNQRFYRYSIKDGLPSNVITNIIGDDQNNLWITTIKGLSKYNYKSFRNFDVDDGLQGLEFNAEAYLKNKKGEIYIGGSNGFNIFSPVDLRDNPFPPSVVITSFLLFNKVEKSFYELSLSDELNLSYSDKFFSFEFAALDFTNPEKNKYLYMMEGFDEEWRAAGNDRRANYTNLDPGEYIFKVKASNNDGIWNEQGSSLKIVIAPPFYKTWWAYTFYAVVILIALVSLRKYEINKRRKKEEEKLRVEREEAQIREAELKAEAAELKTKAMESEREKEKQQIRTRIAADLHDEIGSNLSSIILLSSILKNNGSKPDESKKFIENINYAAKISAEGIRDIIWFINPLSDHLDKLVYKLKETANTMLSGFKVKFETGEINKAEKLNPDIKKNIYLIFKETLNNIVKHSDASEVIIKIEENNGKLFINLKDNGKGFDGSSAINGNGLINMKLRAEEANGLVEVNSIKGVGTTVRLEVEIT